MNTAAQEHLRSIVEDYLQEAGLLQSCEIRDSLVIPSRQNGEDDLWRVLGTAPNGKIAMLYFIFTKDVPKEVADRVREDMVQKLGPNIFIQREEPL